METNHPTITRIETNQQMTKVRSFIVSTQKKLQKTTLRIKKKRSKLRNYLKHKLRRTPYSSLNQISNNESAEITAINTKLDKLVQQLEHQTPQNLHEDFLRQIIRRLEQLLSHNDATLTTMASIQDDIFEVQRLLRVFKGTKIEDNYFIIDNKINQLMIQTDALQIASPEMRQRKIELQAKLKECSDEFDGKCASAPPVLADSERAERISTIAELKSDFQITAKKMREFKGGDGIHNRIDDKLNMVFNRVRQVDDKTDEMVARAKNELVADVQNAMTELQTNYENCCKNAEEVDGNVNKGGQILTEVTIHACEAEPSERKRKISRECYNFIKTINEKTSIPSKATPKTGALENFVIDPQSNSTVASENAPYICTDGKNTESAPKIVTYDGAAEKEVLNDVHNKELPVFVITKL